MVVVVILIVINLSRVLITTTIHSPVYWGFNITGLACGILTYSGLIKVLKQNKEATWLTIPYYGLIAGNILNFITTSVITPLITNQKNLPIYLLIPRITNIPYYFVLIFLFVSVFLIKTKSIARYFKMYVLTLITGMFATFFLNFAFIYFINRYAANHFSVNWLKYMQLIGIISTVIYSIPLIFAFLLFYHLYTTQENFSIGQPVVLNLSRAALPAGSIGTITQKHSNGDYYYVEFTSENAKETLILPDTDISHIDAPDGSAKDYIKPNTPANNSNDRTLSSGA